MSSSAALSRTRRAGVAFLAAVVASLGLVGAGAVTRPASAATAVRFCFTYSNPPTFSAYANKPVFLYYKAPHGWEYLGRSGSTGANGCGTFYNTPTNVQLAVRAYTSTPYMAWDGWSQYSSHTGAGTNHLGNGNVYRIR